jgi:Polysaccharide lyase
VTSLTLVNADTDKDIRTLSSGDTLDLSTLPTPSLNIRANTSGPTLSVRFGLDANSNFRTENTAPFALAGDSAGDYYPWTPTAGSHTLVATPFAVANAGGTAGTAKTVTFTVTSGSGSVASSSGSVVFDGDIETGNLSQWSQVQCANYGLASNTEFTRGNSYAVGDIFGQGTFSARFDLPPSSNKSACELTRGPFANDIGNDTWYGMEVRFPTNWVEPGGWGGTFTQLHFQWPNIWAGPLQLVAHADRVEVALQSGRCAFGTGCSTTLKPIAVPAGQLTLGVWHEFVIHAHWATDNTGVVEIWWRRKGETTWNKTVSLSGVPTLQLDLNGNLVSTGAYDKIGFYRGASSNALSLWQDAFCRATSFAAAVSCES